MTDPSTKPLQRNFAGIAGHVPPEQPVSFAGIRTWLKRLVVREIRASCIVPDDSRRTANRLSATGKRGSGSAPPMLIRLRREDKLLLDARADARGLRPATYASVLLRAHLRDLTPLPHAELAAMKLVSAESGAIGRNLNQVARSMAQGTPAAGVGHDQLRAILSVCEALRDHTKNLIKANAAS